MTLQVLVSEGVSERIYRFPSAESWSEVDGYLSLYDDEGTAIAEYAPGWKAVWLGEDSPDAAH